MSLTPLDLHAWVATNAPPAPPAPQGDTPRRERLPVVNGHPDRFAKYAAAALEREITTLEATSEGGRNNALNRAAVALGEFVGAGQLDQATVETALAGAAARIGLGDIEIRATIASGLGCGMAQPRRMEDIPDNPPPRPPRGDGGDGQPGDDPELISEDNPHKLARIFLREHYSHADRDRLAYWRDEFHSWEKESGAYRPRSKGELRAEVADFTAREFDRAFHDKCLRAGMAAARGDDKAKMPRLLPVTTNLTGHVYQALAGMTILSSATYPEQPCWIGDDRGWPVHEVMPMRNGIIHLPAFIDGGDYIRPPTPNLFCGHSLDYDFDPHAPEPKLWLEFLKQLWPDDPQTIETLQEWMGLQLVPDIRYQKIMAFIGPIRAGKGTISGIMQQLVGEQNCTTPAMDSFEDTFGLQGWIGKLSAIFDDVRLSHKSNMGVISERLLSISGGGTINIRRAYKGDPWTGKLTTRITMLSNEMPRFADGSGALPNRFIVLKFKKSFFNNEDLTLADRLVPELPGILLWAIEGWKRLRDRGRLIQPESGRGELGSMKAMASPISQFVEDCGDVGEGEKCRCPDAYRAWVAWCGENGIKEPGNAMVFARNLRSVVPELDTKQVNTKAWRGRVFVGFGLKPPSEAFGDAPQGGAVGSFIPDDDEAPPVPF